MPADRAIVDVSLQKQQIVFDGNAAVTDLDRWCVGVVIPPDAFDVLARGGTGFRTIGQAEGFENLSPVVGNLYK